MTATRIGEQCLFVINRDLFTGFDVPPGEEQHVTIERLHVGVRIAGMIDEMGSVPTTRAVQAPPTVDVADAQVQPALGPSLRFGVRNAFAGILSDFLSALEWLRRETAATVDSGFLDGETRREF